MEQEKTQQLFPLDVSKSFKTVHQKLVEKEAEKLA
jgi:hypothetical protein